MNLYEHIITSQNGSLVVKVTFRRSALLVAVETLQLISAERLCHDGELFTLVSTARAHYKQSSISPLSLSSLLRCLSLMVCVHLSLACALGVLLYYSKESGSLRFPFARLLTLLFPSLPPLCLLPQDFQREFAALMKQILKSCTQSSYACVDRKTTETRLRWIDGPQNRSKSRKLSRPLKHTWLVFKLFFSLTP